MADEPQAGFDDIYDELCESGLRFDVASAQWIDSSGNAVSVFVAGQTSDSPYHMKELMDEYDSRRCR